MSTAATLAPPDVRDSLDRFLTGLAAEGGVRAFAVGTTTCVLRWRPLGAHLARGCYWHLELRLRRDEATAEHVTTLSDLSLLTRWLDHHLRYFESQLGDAPSPVAARPATTRALPAASPADLLRARLAAAR